MGNYLWGLEREGSDLRGARVRSGRGIGELGGRECLGRPGAAGIEDHRGQWGDYAISGFGGEG
jgi:hypothetical protein